MKASLPLRSFSTPCRSQFRPGFYRRTPSSSPRRWNSTNSSSGAGPASDAASSTKAFWTTSRALVLAVAASSGAYAFASTRGSLSSTAQAKEAPRYGDIKQFEKAIAELRTDLGEDAISTDDDDLHDHGYSEWSSVNADRLPVAIAYPKTTEEVSKIAKVCHKYRMPMVPYSGGSSLEANFSAPYGGMTIDFAFMDRILEVHENDLDVVVQPSIQWMHLNKELENTGLFFPVDPGPSAKIGGMVGTNCSGTNAVRYGTMKDWVVNLTVVLADGQIIKTRRRPRKTSAGYNLTGMFVGSEGTLGIVTEITLKLAPSPEQMRVGIVTFPSIRDAASAAMQVTRRAVPVQSMEIMDDVQMNVINRAGGTGRVWKELPTLFFKFSGTKAQIEDSIRITKEIVKNNKSTSFEFAKNEQEGHVLWSARKESLWSMLSLRKEGSEVWSTDVAVPISRLPDIIEKSKEELDDLKIFASLLGHIGDGNFHTSIMYNRKDPDERARVETVVHNMVNRALEMEGSCTGEHGIGLGKKESLVSELGPDTINVMRNIKRALDPHWLMNPGKIFDYSTDSKPTSITDLESGRLAGAQKKD
ncbi:oxidoreductase, FAD-binding protein [Talaromyces proteolyticus]|uniref:D-lactate dehydrogenase (cytochrome) n=1 Tax=Talaromyces proteolyticus TaxID=1131652 RepID=A0AAD4L140_9EURO|nr:oxidoreductase, FAD-binding protein [Talaromyces proteolyticus]KAH8703711.1 oxidoreductase, FAD-binding protein [Talaromyces proteolyticus]